MSTEQIKQLHEQASQRYLNGDYRGAIEAWRHVLDLDPVDEQAQNGVLMDSQFVDPETLAPQHALASAASDIENELDRGLQILDGIGGKDVFSVGGEGSVDRAPAAEEDSFAFEPIDLSTLSPDPLPEFTDESMDSIDSMASMDSMPEPAEAPPPSPSPASSAAAAELKRRVEDLLGEAKAKAEAGERDEALAILSRLAILDEDNAEAEALRASLETASASEHDKVEQAIIEGVAALEADRLDDAERFFRDALARAPGHREAQHYLEKVAERRAGTHEDLLADFGGEAPPADAAVARATANSTAAIPLAVPSEPSPSAKAGRPPAPDPELQGAPPVVRRPRRALPSARVLILASVGVAALVAAAIAVPALSRRPAPPGPAPKPVAAARRGPRAASPPTNVVDPAIPASPEVREKVVTAALAKGQSLMAAGDFGEAVIAFNEALTADPGSAAAKAGILAAGDRYKASKAEREMLESIKLAFRDGEFTSGLRLAYRLPPGVTKTQADGIKVAGWYNLAVVALRARDCHEALSHLDEALQLAPADTDAKKLREFAARYADTPTDRSFLNQVEALAFRPFPAS